jgi:type III secretory pathway component EscU
VCLVLGGLELLVQHVARLRRLRMTRHALQAEQRELAGDPRMMSERRARVHLSPQLAASDLVQLSAAAVVITGTACVVALEYTPELGVPRVWLSAEGPQALELLSRAYSLQLPIFSDELLATALSRTPLRAAIPAEWHTRVAQLLVASAVPAVREAS